MTDFHLLSYTSTSEIPALTEAWKSYPFRAEPPCIGLYRAYYLNVYWYHHHQINGMINWPGLFGFGVNAKLWANLEIIIGSYDRWQIQIFRPSFFSIPQSSFSFFPASKNFMVVYVQAAEGFWISLQSSCCTIPWFPRVEAHIWIYEIHP